MCRRWFVHSHSLLSQPLALSTGTMSTDSGSSSGSSEGEEDQQLVQQVVTGANADPQVLQYFWDLASLQQVGATDQDAPCFCFRVLPCWAVRGLCGGLQGWFNL